MPCATRDRTGRVCDRHYVVEDVDPENTSADWRDEQIDEHGCAWSD